MVTVLIGHACTVLQLPECQRLKRRSNSRFHVRVERIIAVKKVVTAAAGFKEGLPDILAVSNKNAQCFVTCVTIRVLSSSLDCITRVGKTRELTLKDIKLGKLPADL